MRAALLLQPRLGSGELLLPLPVFLLVLLLLELRALLRDGQGLR